MNETQNMHETQKALYLLPLPGCAKLYYQIIVVRLSDKGVQKYIVSGPGRGRI